VEKTITKKYGDIRNLKVSTLLHQNRVHDALFMSINFGKLTIKPYEKFSKFDE
jgi:hypothetical protein